MANEAVIIELLGNGGDPISYTVPDDSAVAKGTLCNLVDPRTTSGSSVVTADIPAGIASHEKVASDGSTRIACYTNGIFDMVLANEGCTIGEILCMSGANLVRPATEAEIQLGASIGRALETGTASETIAVRVRL